jgi:hypothetical protein
MAAITPLFEDKVKRAIRDAMVYDPLMTQSGLIEHLNEKFDHSFSPQYISRLSKKVVGQARHEFETAKIGPRLASLRENHRIAREALLRILLWNPLDAVIGVVQGTDEFGMRKPAARDIAEAAKNLVMLDIAVLNAEVANGLYKNLDEAAAKLDYPALPAEQRGTIASTFKKWNILPPGSLVESITIHATRAITPAE